MGYAQLCILNANLNTHLVAKLDPILIAQWSMVVQASLQMFSTHDCAKYLL